MDLKIYHLGRDIWLLSRMPWKVAHGNGYYQVPREEFLKILLALQYRNLFTFTANKYQKDACDVLAQAGFKQILTFDSAHNENDETITLWAKYDQNAPIKEDNPIGDDQGDHYEGNCSIIFGDENDGYRCVITVKQEGAKPPINFNQVDDTNLYIKIDPTFDEDDSNYV